MKHRKTSKSARKHLLPAKAVMYGVAMTLPALAAAEEEAPVLKTVEITADQDTPAETSYQGGKTRVGKLDQLPKDIPQSVSIVTNKLMADRNADTFREALRNVAGLTFNAGEGGRIGDNITLRGYSAVGDLYLDGMRDMAQYNRETFNLEQIDVLRGSSSMLFGRGSTGGVINQVSKQALLTDRHIISTTQGSYDYQRYTADLNQKLGSTTALRLNLMDTETNSFRDEVHLERSGYAPTITFGIGTANQFTFSHYHLEDDNIPDYGIPYFDRDGGVVGTKDAKPLDVDISTFYGMSNVDYEINDTDISTASFTHLFNKDTELRTRFRYAEYDRDLWAVAPRLITVPPTGGTPASPIDKGDIAAIRRGHQGRGSDEVTMTNQTDLITLKEIFGLQHQLLFGMEVIHEKMTRWNNQTRTAGGIVINNPNADPWSPDPTPVLPAGYRQGMQREAFNYYTGDTYASYFQDIIGLTNEWKLLIGARRDYSDAEYDRFVAATTAPPAPQTRELHRRKDIVNSWRTGLLYQPDETTTYYVSRGSSFNPSAELYQLDPRGDSTPPEKSINTEVGAKWDLFDGEMSLRTSLSRSEKLNERNTDLANPNVFLLSGKRHTDAVEVEVTGHLTQNWEVFTALAYLEANVDEASGQQAGSQDMDPVNTPHYTFSLWNTFNLDKGFRIGAGVDGAGDRYANANNTAVVPAYWRWDAMASYRYRNLQTKLNVLNLFDTEYYEGVYSGHVIPGQARSVQLSFDYRF